MAGNEMVMPRAGRRRVVASSLLGTTIEFFDLYIYGLAAGLYFGQLFFSEASPAVGVIASFGTLAIGFLVRPIGGIVGGHFGDRYGRKKVLVASLIVMGVSTVAVGLLPTYETIGIAAPIVLLVARLAQGLGAGAEYGGGVLILVEHMGKNRRGFWGSIVGCGIWLGIALGTLVFAVITRLPEDVQLWAWRIPFIASAALVFVGLWIRLGVAETPAFARIAKSVEAERMPIARLFRGNKRPIILATLIALGAGASYQIYGTFGTSYAKSLDLPISTILGFQFLNGVFAVAITLFFGWLSDRTGRRILAIVGSVIVVPALYLFFWSLNEGLLPMVLVSLLVLEVGHSMVAAPLGAFLAEMFETRERYTGVSIAYQIGAGAFAGLGPLIASTILTTSGGPPNVYSVPLIIVVVSILAGTAAYLAPDRARKPLPEAAEDDIDTGYDLRVGTDAGGTERPDLAKP
ncbi:MFS transporter [Rhodococcus koreensis]|uniref:MFS transporter n=1 Tax=Rhodococcus koreensis TaxID=99653 RepID=UPI00366FCDCD